MRPSIKPLVQIIKYLKNKSYPIKPITQVTDQERRRRLNVLHDVLELLRGGEEDNSFILESFLTQKRNQKYQQHLLKTLETQTKTTNVIGQLCRAHNNNPSLDNKRQILSLLAESHSFPQLKQMGFHIKPHNLTSARKHAARHGSGAQVPKPSPPLKKRKMTQEDENKFHQFLENHSREAAARTIGGIPVRYVDSK